MTFTDKSGNPVAPSVPRNSFWCAFLAANKQFLPSCTNPNSVSADLNFVFDPFINSWIAIDNEVIPEQNNAPVEIDIAVTTPGTDPSNPANWNRWMIAPSQYCSGHDSSLGTIADNPIIGFSSSTIAIDVFCFSAIGPTFTVDSELLIPNASVTTSPAPPNLNNVVSAESPFPQMRVARDSSPGYSNLVLVASDVPSGGSGQAKLAVSTMDSSGNSVTPLLSTGLGFPNSLTYNLPPGPQSGCTTLSSGCMIQTNDARIETASIEQRTSDGKHYLQVAFPVGYSTGGEAIWASGQLESMFPSLGANQWNYGYVGGTTWVPAYPTLAADQYLDLLGTFVSFVTTGPPFTDATTWQNTVATDTTLIGFQGAIVLGSNGTYTGTLNCPTPAPTPSPTPTGATPTPTPTTVIQRWGDYNSTSFDPTTNSPNTFPGAFWTAEEYTNGGSDQSTEWLELAVPLPYFIAYSPKESECSGLSNGQNCAVTFTTPSGLQKGDVIIADLYMGGRLSNPPTPPDSTWKSIPIANLGNALTMTQGTCGALDLQTEFLLAHVYGSSSETGTYKFKHSFNTYCPHSTFVLAPEIGGNLYAYRAGSATLSSYVLYGYPASGPSGTITVGPAPANSPSLGTLLNIFDCNNSTDSPESSEFAMTFMAPTQTPLATPEMPLSNSGGASLVADLGIGNSGTSLGQYSAQCSGDAVATNSGWQLFIPKQQ